MIAFTFDDGPDWVTPMILDLLKDTDDRVTFFITGYMIDKNPKNYSGYVRRAFEMGCDIGLHTYNHTNLYYASTQTDATDEVIERELGDLDAKIFDILGEKSWLLRPPGGSLNKKRNYGYASILWSVDSEDWKTFSEHRAELLSSDPVVKSKAQKEAAQEIASRVLKEVQPGDIVLMHDIYETSAMAFAEIYEALKAEGYRFVTVSELLKIQPEEYTGWYFYSSAMAGRDGELTVAQRQSAAPVLAVPPKKFS